MALNFRASQNSDVLLIAVEGDLLLCPELRHSSNLIRQASQVKGFIVDLSASARIDSAGLGELLSWFNLARRANQSVVLCGVNDSIRTVMRMARVDGVLPIVSTQEEAFRTLKT